VSSAQEPTSSAAGIAATSSDAVRAQALLARAVLRIKEVGDRALAEFGRQGEFTDKELYVYVLDTTGTMLTSGGSSATLIGRNLSNMRDVSGKPFFAEMVDKAQNVGYGEVHYRWLNWTDNSVQRKHAYFEKVGDRILSVGYYINRSSPEQTRAFLDRAVEAMEIEPSSAIREFNRLDGRFVQDDLYVFVIDRKSGHFVAHGSMPRLVGTDGSELRDKAGTPIIRPMLAQAVRDKSGELDYLWKNPVTRKTEPKRTVFKVVDRYIVAVGYFKP
jgi:cytochrome c